MDFVITATSAGPSNIAESEKVNERLTSGYVNVSEGEPRRIHEESASGKGLLPVIVDITAPSADLPDYFIPAASDEVARPSAPQQEFLPDFILAASDDIPQAPAMPVVMGSSEMARDLPLFFTPAAGNGPDLTPNLNAPDAASHIDGGGIYIPFGDTPELLGLTAVGILAPTDFDTGRPDYDPQSFLASGFLETSGDDSNGDTSSDPDPVGGGVTPPPPAPTPVPVLGPYRGLLNTDTGDVHVQNGHSVTDSPLTGQDNTVPVEESLAIIPAVASDCALVQDIDIAHHVLYVRGVDGDDFSKHGAGTRGEGWWQDNSGTLSFGDYDKVVDEHYNYIDMGGLGRDWIMLAGKQGSVLNIGTTGYGANIVIGTEDAVGSMHADVIIGSKDANILIGGAGDDHLWQSLLDGKDGGGDILLGGSGNDDFHVTAQYLATELGKSVLDHDAAPEGVQKYLASERSDNGIDNQLALSFANNHAHDVAQIHGGSGFDRISVVDGGNLGSAFANGGVHSIEAIDLLNGKSNQLSLNVADVLNMTDGDHLLIVSSDQSDTVTHNFGQATQTGASVHGMTGDLYVANVGGQDVSLFLTHQVLLQIDNPLHVNA